MDVIKFHDSLPPGPEHEKAHFTAVAALNYGDGPDEQRLYVTTVKWDVARRQMILVLGDEVPLQDAR